MIQLDIPANPPTKQCEEGRHSVESILPAGSTLSSSLVEKSSTASAGVDYWTTGINALLAAGRVSTRATSLLPSQSDSILPLQVSTLSTSLVEKANTGEEESVDTVVEESTDFATAKDFSTSEEESVDNVSEECIHSVKFACYHGNQKNQTNQQTDEQILRPPASGK